jgi:hypothetical protein
MTQKRTSEAIAEGERLLESGEYAAAAGCFEQVLVDSAAELPALRGLAEACFGLGDKSGAKHYVGLALQSDPSDPRTLNDAGVLLFHEKDYENASLFLTKAVAIAPDFGDAHINLCAVWGRLTLADQKQAIKSDQLLSSLHWIADHRADPVRDELLTLNNSLRQALLDRHRGCFEDYGLRVLLHAPTSLMGALFYIFESWQQCLSFTGIDTRMVLAGDPIVEIVDNFDPNVLITVDHPEVSGALDWSFIYEHMNRHRLLIGLCSDFRTKPREADFYLTFHLDPSQDESLSQVKAPLLSVPFAFNPLLHRMSPAQTLFDFAFVGTNSPVKQKETLDYLIPIVRGNVGILAGTGWPGRFNNLSQADAGFLYNFAAICPNYHLSAQIDTFNEVNERTHVLQACGAFQLCDQPKAMAKLYAEDELVTAATPSEYQSCFNHYLERPEERAIVARRGMIKAWNSFSQFAALRALIDHLRRTV